MIPSLPASERYLHVNFKAVSYPPAEANAGPSQASQMELFARIVNPFLILMTCIFT